jgi:hypothetical protein
VRGAVFNNLAGIGAARANMAGTGPQDAGGLVRSFGRNGVPNTEAPRAADAAFQSWVDTTSAGTSRSGLPDTGFSGRNAAGATNLRGPANVWADFKDAARDVQAGFKDGARDVAATSWKVYDDTATRLGLGAFTQPKQPSVAMTHIDGDGGPRYFAGSSPQEADRLAMRATALRLHPELQQQAKAGGKGTAQAAPPGATAAPPAGGAKAEQPWQVDVIRGPTMGNQFLGMASHGDKGGSGPTFQREEVAPWSHATARSDGKDFYARHGVPRPAEPAPARGAGAHPLQKLYGQKFVESVPELEGAKPTGVMRDEDYTFLPHPQTGLPVRMPLSALARTYAQWYGQGDPGDLSQLDPYQ